MKPTVQQREMLEGIYRNGMHTPTVKDIETITSRLKNYGRIEGKNVFYWFQNFNASEKQNRKRTLELSHTLSEEDGTCYIHKIPSDRILLFAFCFLLIQIPSDRILLFAFYFLLILFQLREALRSPLQNW